IAALSFAAYPDALPAIVAGSTERAAVQGASTWTLVLAVLGSAAGIVIAMLLVALAAACVVAARLAPDHLRIHAVVAMALVAGLSPAERRPWSVGLIALAFVVGPWLLQAGAYVPGTPSLAGAAPFVVGLAVVSRAVSLWTARERAPVEGSRPVTD